MESDASRILHELQSLRASKSDIDRRISALETQLHQINLLNDSVPNGSHHSISTIDNSHLNGPHAHYLTPEMIHRYSRHLLLPSFGVQAQSNLLKSSVLVVGAGGLGSPALLYLAACGVGRLGIVDHDVVELNNMHRQIIHTEAFIGQPKVKSAAAACRSVNSTVQIVEHHEALRTSNALGIFSNVITDKSSESDTYFDTEPNSEEGFRVDPHHIGKSELEVKQAAKPNVTTAKQVRIVEPNKVEDTDEDVDEDTSSDEESSDESDDDEAKAISEEESSENDDDGSDGGSDDDSSEDEDKETPKELKAKANKKRPMEPAKKTPADKKAKFISPEKTDVKKFSGHVATPHPSKQTVTKQQTPKSGGAYPCKSCNRSFSSETGLQSHTKAKHSAAQ